jgi:RecJ-like exonuclease
MTTLFIHPHDPNYVRRITVVDSTHVKLAQVDEFGDDLASLVCHVGQFRSDDSPLGIAVQALIRDYKESLKPCETCGGKGEIKTAVYSHPTLPDGTERIEVCDNCLERQK